MIGSSRVQLPAAALSGNDLGQVVHTNVPLFTKQYNLVPCEGFHVNAPYVAANRSNEQGEYCSKRFSSDRICLEPRYTLSTLPFYLLRQVEKEGGTTEYVDAHDEDLCNWMMFVRPATNPADQNLVAYQHGNDIFFTVIKNIEPRQELKVR